MRLAAEDAASADFIVVIVHEPRRKCTIHRALVNRRLRSPADAV